MIPIGDDRLTRRTPIVTYLLIAGCTLVYLWQSGLAPIAFEISTMRFGAIPAVITGAAEVTPQLAPLPPWATLVSSLFLHGSWAHLLGNMLYLWIFGGSVEDRLGRLPFMAFYIGCGLCASGAQILPEPRSTLPIIGASGAISGVLGAYALLFPRANVTVFIPFSLMFLHQIQAFWLLILWLGLQIVSGLVAPAGEGGVAWWAHVGGFLAGAFVVAPFREALRGPPPPRREPPSNAEPPAGPSARSAASREPGRRGPWG